MCLSFTYYTIALITLLLFYTTFASSESSSSNGIRLACHTITTAQQHECACIADFLLTLLLLSCMHTSPQHGRIAMLAIVGLVVAQFVRLPGDIYQGVSVVEAHNAMVEKGPMVQLLFWLSLFELLTAPLVWNMDAKVSQQTSCFMMHMITSMRATQGDG
jgi:Chlorophyll A-B binding protein